LALLTALGRLWLEGLNVDWGAFYGAEQRRRLPLPTYPFERRRCWIEPPKPASGNGQHKPALPKEGQESPQPSLTPARAASLSLAEQVMENQLRLMGSQLEALGIGGNNGRVKH
jgi:acyl transferase domain-containing protein